MKLLRLSALALLVASCGGGGGGSGDDFNSRAPTGGSPGGGGTTPSPPSDPTKALLEADKFEIGPIINGTNYSSRMPISPTQTTDGMKIEFPFPDKAAGHVHYVTRAAPQQDLSTKTAMVIKYRIEGPADLKISPTNYPEMVSIFTLYFQVKGDNWAQDGGRWWATFASKMPLTPGEYEIRAPFTSNWTSVMSATAESSPSLFQNSLKNVARIGFTFGGGDGYGHGVFASHESRIVITDFYIE